MARCDLTELERDQCAHCRKSPDPFADETTKHVRLQTAPGPWFEAKFRSKCACGEDIHAGDEIRADGQGGYQGRCCDEGEDL